DFTGVTAPFHARDENTLDCGGTTPLLLRAWLVLLRLNSLPLSPCLRCRKSGDMSPQSKAAPHLPRDSCLRSALTDFGIRLRILRVFEDVQRRHCLSPCSVAIPGGFKIIKAA